jgi:hypothetical protein
MFANQDHLDLDIRVFAFVHRLLLPMLSMTTKPNQPIRSLLPSSVSKWINAFVLKMVLRFNIKIERILKELNDGEMEYDQVDRLLRKIKPLRELLEQKMLDVPRMTLIQSALGQAMLRNFDLTLRVMSKLEQLQELHKPKPPLQIPVFKSPCPFDMKETFRRADMYND